MSGRTCLILSALALAACAAFSADVTKTYELIKPVGAPYSRILVVGAHPDDAIRRQLENTLVDSLREDGIDAISSVSVIDPDAQLSHATVDAAAESSRADAVLVSRLQDVRRSTTESEAGSTIDQQRAPANSLLDFFRGEYADYEDPMSVTEVQRVVVTTALYRMSDRTRIWAVETSAVEKENVVALLEKVAASSSGQLRRDQLVR